MLVKDVQNQIDDQAAIKAGASGTNWKLVAFDKETSFRDSMANKFCEIHDSTQDNIIKIIIYIFVFIVFV